MKSRLLALILLLGLVIRPATNGFLRSDSNDTGIQMLEAFVGDRDYSRALTLTRTVPAGSEFRDEADVLERELPKRMNDFKTLKLPTPGEWATIQNRLSREEKIRYLCDRLRLMNYFNDDKWGTTVEQEQFAEPRHMNCGSIPRGRGQPGCELGSGKTETINPLMILDDAAIGRGSHTSTFDLTLDDIPLLTEYMEKDWAVLGLNYWHLDRTSGLLGLIVYQLSDEFFSYFALFDHMPDAKKRESIRNVRDWALASHGLSKAERLARRVKEVKSWSEISWLDDDIAASKRADLVPYLFKMVDRLIAERNQPDQFDYQSSLANWVLGVCESLDVRMTAEKTRGFLDDGNPGLRLMAGRLEYLYGDKEKGARALCSALQGASWSNFYITGANSPLAMLLKDKEPCAIASIQPVLQKDYFKLSTRSDQAEFLKMIRDVGRSEGYRWLLASLADSTPTSSWSGDAPILVRDVAGELTASYLAPSSAGLTYDLKATPRESEKPTENRPVAHLRDPRHR